MIYVATYIEVQPASTSQGIALLGDYRKACVGNGGCVRVEALQEIHRQHRFVLIETWDAEASLATHETAEHTLQFRAGLKRIQKSPYDQRVHQEFAVGGLPESGKAQLTVVTHVDVPPPRREETEALLRTAVEEFRKEQGNLRFDIFQQIAPRTNHFTLVAQWSDDRAFAMHEASAPTRQFRERLGPMLGALYDERLYRANH